MDNVDLWIKATNLRKQLGEDANSPIDIFPLVYNIDSITIVFYPMGERISGMCIKGHDNIVIAINSAMSVGRQRFSMAHELYHVYYDKDLSTTVCSKKIGIGKEVEQKADKFASFFLIPPNALDETITRVKKNTRDKLNVADVVKIEQYFGVSRQAILLRLIEKKEITEQEADCMREGVVNSARNLGYDDSLYKPLPPEKQYITYGHYIQQADKVFEKGLVSSGKYEELLLDAFRTDLVYGEESEGGELVD